MLHLKQEAENLMKRKGFWKPAHNYHQGQGEGWGDWSKREERKRRERWRGKEEEKESKKVKGHLRPKIIYFLLTDQFPMTDVLSSSYVLSYILKRVIFLKGKHDQGFMYTRNNAEDFWGGLHLPLDEQVEPPSWHSMTQSKPIKHFLWSWIKTVNKLAPDRI